MITAARNDEQQDPVVVDPSHHRGNKRWLRFGLRSFLLLITVFAVAFGLWTNTIRQRRAAVSALQTAGGSVTYAWELSQGERKRRLLETISAKRAGMPACIFREPSPAGPVFLRRILGENAFASVITVSLSKGLIEIRAPEADQEKLLRRLATFKQLENLTLNGPWDGDQLGFLSELTALQVLTIRNAHLERGGLPDLSGLRRLESLSLYRSRVANHDLRGLDSLESLKSLSIEEASIDDAGLAHLRKLTTLERLYLCGTRITRPGAGALSVALTSCEFEFRTEYGSPVQEYNRQFATPDPFSSR